MKKEFENESVIIIEGWMVSELKLKGNDLIIFAIIHGASKDGEPFCGSISYLEITSGACRTTVTKTLKRLVDLDLVSKKFTTWGNQPRVEYRSLISSKDDSFYYEFYADLPFEIDTE